MAAEKLPYVHGAGEPQEDVTMLGERARGIVDQWLAGVRAVQDGTFDMFFIETSDHSGQMVKPGNAADVERDLIAQFGPHYPEIVPQPEV